jgi:molybdopterin-guanine dinucleotide biosynthesis protein A
MSLTKSLKILILAGGKSRRMGRDKALLPLGEASFLAATVAIARQLSPAIWVSTPWREEYREIFTQGVQWLDDPLQEGGLMALTQFLREQIQNQAENDWVLLLACDLPHLQIEQLQTWINQLEQIPDHYQAALVRQQDGQSGKSFYEPLCGFYRTTAITSLEKFVAGGDRSFQRWLATEQVYELDLAEENMLFNCNTPADFATLKANQ